MDYGEVLSRAWRIIWKYKILWIFGILSSCGSNAQAPQMGNQAQYDFNANELPPGLQNFLNQLEQIEPWVIFLIVALVVLGIIVLTVITVFLNTIGKIGLIRGTQLGDTEPAHLSFGQLFSESMPYFWRVFGFNLLAGIVILVAFLFIGLPLILVTCFTALLCIIPLMWVVQLVIEQTNIAIVVENLGIMAGMERAWDVVKTNAVPMFLMALILYLGVSTIGGLLISLPLVLIFGPAVVGLIVGTTTNLEAALPGGLVVAGLCLAAYLPILIVLGGIMQAYISSGWTLTFMRLTRPRPEFGGEISPEPQSLEPGI